MSAPRAADLPVGSVVATATKAYVRTDLPNFYAWSISDSEWHVPDESVDRAIADGAQVLRVGDGSDR